VSAPAIKTICTVFLKEIRESLRDRRTLLNALLVGPLLGPLMFVIVIKMVVAREIQRAERPLPVVVIGAEYAPNLITALEQAGLERKPAIEQPEAAVRAQTVDLVLRIPADYGETWRHGKSAQVELIYDSSRRDINSSLQRLRTMLRNYTGQQSSLRVVARGLSPEITRPLMVADRDQATPQARGAALFAMVPYFLIFTALIGGMFLAIDAIAGERERQSLEPLFINPVQRGHILLGKLAAISTFSMTSVLLNLIAFTVAGTVLSRGMENFPVVMNFGFALGLLPLMLPLTLLIAALQVLVTAFARTFREAQTWLGFMQLIPTIPMVVVMVLEVKPVLWMYAVPLLGQQLAAMQLLRGVGISPGESALCVLSTLAAALLVFRIVERVYNSERLAIAG
jgi:sodium transport system permease protein